MNASEPLRTLRKAQSLSKPVGMAALGLAEEKPVYCLSGSRSKGGMRITQAPLGNVRT